MLEDVFVLVAVALYIMAPIIIGELLDKIFRVSWSLIKPLE